MYSCDFLGHIATGVGTATGVMQLDIAAAGVSARCALGRTTPRAQDARATFVAGHDPCALKH